MILTIKAQDVIDKLPFELADRLSSDPFFCDVTVVVAEKGNVKLEIERKMAALANKGGKRGVGVVVLQMAADDDESNLQFGPMTLRPAFQVIEVVELNHDANGTKKSARKVARRIRDAIKTLGLTGMTTTMEMDSPGIHPVDLAGDPKNLVGYQVNFKCREQTGDPLRQASTPQFSSDGNGITISTMTAGSVIYFTTDDSFPWSGGASSQVFSGMIVVPVDGVTVRAMACAPGFVDSSVNRRSFNQGQPGAGF